VGFFKRFKKPKSSVSLTVPKNTVELGEDLKGAITVSCEDEFDATEVRAELRCVEKRRRERWERNDRGRSVRRVYWDTATLHSADPKASGKLHMLPGFKKTFPISINVPAGGRESFDGLDSNVSWFIKGVVAIDGRPDVTSKTIELQVVRPAAPVAVKEKEVVMVPCEYCGSMMPETATSCPNCGAPRKT
jgi:hypothetical protein